MSHFRIVCTKQEPHSPGHGHIVQVGTGTIAGTYSQLWSVAAVYTAMDHGHRFFT